MKLRIAAVMICSALAGGTGYAAATEMLGVGTPNVTQFRAKASASDAFEVLSSRIALTHATRPELKDFAQMMIHDHTRSTDKLVALGGISKTSLKLKMEKGRDGKWRENDLLGSNANELNSLDSKSNGDFDRTYIDDQVSGHKDAVSLMEDYARNGDNPKLKKFAHDLLPTIKMHLAKAQELQHAIEH